MMIQTFHACCRAACYHSRRRLVALWMHVLNDLAKSAATERIGQAAMMLSDPEKEGDSLMTAVTYSAATISGTIANAADDSPKGKTPLRIAIVVDMAVCAISCISFILCSGMVQHLDDLRVAFAALLALDGLWLAPILYFAWRGQTIGLAAVKLRWRDNEGRPARRRLCGRLDRPKGTHALPAP